jgi:hypothetical protein
MWFNCHKPLLTIKGRELARRKRTKTQQAFLVRNIVTGKVQLTDLSIRQLATLVNVSATYAYAAIHLQDGDCADVHRGLRPLIRPKPPAIPPSPRERLDQIVAEIGFDAALTLLAASEPQPQAA